VKTLHSFIAAAFMLAITGGAYAEHTNIILHTKEFANVAKDFADFHKKEEGAKSILVAVEGIKAKPRKFKDVPKQEGYQNKKPENFEIKNYDYELALKIVDYLRDYGSKNKLDSVMLLGNSLMIPPSYFFYNDYERDLHAPQNIIDYTSWIGSDIFYGASDFSTNYKWSVGRVSVDNVKQASDYLNKLKKYKQQIKGQDNTFMFAGANVVHDIRYMGEMYRLAMQNKKVLPQATKDYSESDGLFVKQSFLKGMVEDSANNVMFFSHGMGDGIVMADGNNVSVNDILSQPEAKQLKVVFSPSCLNAGIDYNQVPLPFDLTDKVSIGEAIMRSNFAIAYLGSTRLALAAVKFASTDSVNGKIEVTQVKYMPDLLLELLVAHRNGATRLGDAFKQAHDFYMKEKADHESAGFRAMYAAYALIGDPVITMPKPAKFEESTHTGLQMLGHHFTQEIRHDVVGPGYTPSTHHLAPPMRIRMAHSNKAVTVPINYKLINAKTLQVIKRGVLTRGNILAFTPDGDDVTYLLRTWTRPNDDVWQYFYVEKGKEIHPDDYAALEKIENKKHRALKGNSAGLPS
jgi:peptidase C25-like protein